MTQILTRKMTRTKVELTRRLLNPIRTWGCRKNRVGSGRGGARGGWGNECGDASGTTGGQADGGPLRPRRRSCFLPVSIMSTCAGAGRPARVTAGGEWGRAALGASAKLAFQGC